jgi:hypothetical protein
MELKVWIGHYKGNPEEWFVVWAKSKHEAFLQIDPIVGEPDMNSFMELTAPGFVDFTPKEDEKGDYFGYSPPEEDVRGGYWLVFGGAEGKEDDIYGHIKNRMKKTKR